MGKIFNSIGHFFAWVVSKAIPAASAAVTAVQADLSSPLATMIAQALGPKAQQYQAGIEAIAGDVLKSFESAGAAIGADGLNVQFDETTVAAIQQLYGDIKALVKGAPAAGAAAK